MANNGLKYQRLDPQLREEMRRVWNRPVVWPLALLLLAVALSVVPAIVTFRRRERATAAPIGT
ncbi:hypothetical protein D3C83_187810 [compost metagenome]